MFEARIVYENDRKHIVEANTLEMLKVKCKVFVEDMKVIQINVVEVKYIGCLKSPFKIRLL